MIGAEEQELIHKYLLRADLMLFPSLTAANGDMEGIPVSLMEAMACGVPVITTFHSGIPELVNDKVSDLLTKEKSSQAILEKIEVFLSMTAEERIALQENARKTIEKNFCSSIQHKKLLGLLN